MVRRLEESIVRENPDSIVQYKEDYRESTYVMNGGALFIGYLQARCSSYPQC